MEILTRPSNFVRKELRVDNTLIYGDLEGENLSLFSTKPLPLYIREGDVYVRKIGIGDSGVQADCKGLTMSFAAPKAKNGPGLVKLDGENEPSLLSEHRPYAYVCSTDLVRRLNPQIFERYQEGHPFFIEEPRDAVMAHEASHLALSPHCQQEFAMVNFDRFYGSLLKLCFDCYTMSSSSVMMEVVGIFMELKYIQTFYPELEQRYRDCRADEGENSEHNVAYRLICEKPEEVEGFISAIKFSRGWPQRKIVEWVHG